MLDHRGRNVVWFLALAAVLVTLYSSFLLFWTDEAGLTGGWERFKQQDQNEKQQQQQAAAAAAGSGSGSGSGAKSDSSESDFSAILNFDGSKSAQYQRIQKFLFDSTFNTTVFYRKPYTLASLFSRLYSSSSSSSEDGSSLKSQESVQSAVSQLKSYDYDPRLPMSVYLDHINEHFDEITSEGSQFELPFNWYDWADLSSLNDFIDMEPEEKLDCSFVVRKYFPLETVKKLETKFKRKLFDYDRLKPLGVQAFLQNIKLIDPTVSDPIVDIDEHCVSNNSPFSPGFMSIKTLNWSRPEVYNLQARSVLYTNPSAQPLSVTFLNNQSSLQVPVTSANSVGKEEEGSPDQDWKPNSILFNGLLQKFIGKYKKSPKFDPFAIWSQLSPKIKNFQFNGEGHRRLPYKLELNESSFEFNALGRYNELKANEANISAHQRHYMEALELSLNTHYIDLTKYFTEASHVTDMIHLGHHYDGRFFRGGLSHSEVRARLDAIIRAWLHFTVSNDLTAWLAHGTLYGWLYNGLAFTWDGDHDVQMPIADLNRMAKKFNQTVIVEDPTRGNGRYFLDVGTFITARNKGNGLNNIDARFIDVDSGLYVDITGLSVSYEPIADRFEWLVHKYFNDLKTDPEHMPFYEDPNVVPNVSGLSVLDRLKYELALNKTEGQLTRARHEYLSRNIKERDKKELYQSDSLKDRYNINKHAQAYNCRNKHFQTLFELSPLRLTFFHGVPAYVPNLVLKDLNAEYKVPIENGYQCYEGECYVPELRGWYPEGRVKQMVELLVKSPNLKKVFPEDGIKKLEKNEFELLLMEFSQDPKLEELFIYAVNTFQITAFRQRELEFIYDGKMLSYDKNMLLDEFIQNRYFNPVFKDVFLKKQDTAIWNEFVENTDIPYGQIDKLWRELKLKVARQLFKLDEKYANYKIDWANDAGYQSPASPLNFNTRGEKFYIMGKKWNNRLVVRDPVDLDTSITEQYHLSDEKKYTKKKDN